MANFRFHFFSLFVQKADRAELDMVTGFIPPLQLFNRCLSGRFVLENSDYGVFIFIYDICLGLYSIYGIEMLRLNIGIAPDFVDCSRKLSRPLGADENLPAIG